jgi:transposase, IS6 family
MIERIRELLRGDREKPGARLDCFCFGAHRGIQRDSGSGGHSRARSAPPPSLAPGFSRSPYRAVDSTGATLDFLLSAKQDAAAAKRFLAKALGGANHPAPRVINTDGHAAYPSAVAQLKGEGDLSEDCRHRPVPYLNNVLEQDHRAIKRRVNASQHFRSFCAARRTLAGYEAIHMIRKGQASGSASAPGIGLLHRFILGLFAATS